MLSLRQREKHCEVYSFFFLRVNLYCHREPGHRLEAKITRFILSYFFFLLSPFSKKNLLSLISMRLFLLNFLEKKIGCDRYQENSCCLMSIICNADMIWP